jgi:hypothetical protein
VMRCGGEDKEEIGPASECGGMGGGPCKIAYSVLVWWAGNFALFLAPGWHVDPEDRFPISFLIFAR